MVAEQNKTLSLKYFCTQSLLILHLKFTQKFIYGNKKWAGLVQRGTEVVHMQEYW